MRRFASLLCLAALLLPAHARTARVFDIRPTRATAPVANDPDDPAIWVNPKDPARSLIVGTNKVRADEGGAVYVFGLDGKIRQVIPGVDRPNNVDVEYGLKVGGERVDIAVVTERKQGRLRVYRIADAAEPLTEIGRIPVFAGETGEAAEPMGIGLYKRPGDGAVFAVVGRKTGPPTGYLWQYLLKDDGAGRVVGTKVRAFGDYSGKKEIEAIAVDDAKGYVFYGDETFGVRKWVADPANPKANRELARLATTGFKGDHEGIALYTRGDGTGYLVCTDQIAGNAEYHVYRREGEPGRQHDHRELAVLRGGADETDGIEVTSAPLGPDFPRGLLVTMNSKPRNFLLFDWRAAEKAIGSRR
jgi:3-phytase